jgi:hypothetical protein
MKSIQSPNPSTVEGCITLYVDERLSEVNPKDFLTASKLTSYTNGQHYQLPPFLEIVASQETFSGRVAKLMSDFNEFSPGFSQNIQTLRSVNKRRDYQSQKYIESLMKYINEHVCDVVLCINSSGGGFDWFLLLKYFLEDQKSKGGSVTTIAGNRVGSCATQLFSSGDRRIAFPSTQFMVHYPQMQKDFLAGNTTSASSQPVFLQDFYRDEYQFILEAMNGICYEGMRQKFNDAANESGYEVRWLGSESHGFVQEYLVDNASRISQVSQFTDNRYKFRDPTLSFALDCEMERRLALQGYENMKCIVRQVPGRVDQFDISIGPDTTQLRELSGKILQDILGDHIN